VSSKQCDEAESTVTNMAANNSGEEDDLGVLIYRESQLRKAEAAIAAESKKKTSSASTHHRTSTRKKRSPVNMNKQGEKLRNGASKRKRESPSEEDRPREKGDQKETQKI
jgi:hypothetical protein